MKKFLVLIFMLLVLTVLVAGAFAGTGQGTITQIRFNSNGYMLIYVTSLGTPAACAQYGTFAIDDTTSIGKAMASGFLTAYALGKVIYITGNGSCPTGYPAEIVADFYTLN